MAKRNQNEEDLVIYDYPGWKRSPNESNEDYNDRLKDMEEKINEETDAVYHRGRDPLPERCRRFCRSAGSLFQRSL